MTENQTGQIDDITYFIDKAIGYCHSQDTVNAVKTLKRLKMSVESFRIYSNAHQENKMSTIIHHYDSKQQFEDLCTTSLIHSSDLVTYSFDGDYVYIVKSRYSVNNTPITFSDYLDLVKHTLNKTAYEIKGKQYA